MYTTVLPLIGIAFFALSAPVLAQDQASPSPSELPITTAELVELIDASLVKRQSPALCSRAFAPQAAVTPADAALMIMCVLGEHYDDAEKALHALGARIVIPRRRRIMENLMTVEQAESVMHRLRLKGWAGGHLSRRSIRSIAWRRYPWVNYTNEEFGFTVQHPPDVRMRFDENSNAIRFIRLDRGEWRDGWTIWLNDESIERFSTIGGVIDHIRPDDMGNGAQRTVMRETIEVDGHLASFVTVKVTGDRADPWIYRIAFLDLCHHMYEISAQTSTWLGFERFLYSFHLLNPVDPLRARDLQSFAACVKSETNTKRLSKDS